MIKKPAQEFKTDLDALRGRKQLCNSVAACIKHGYKLNEREMKLTEFKSANKYSFRHSSPSKRVKTETPPVVYHQC